MGRSAGKLTIPAIAPGLQAHQTDGARARRPPRRCGRIAIRAAVSSSFLDPAGKNTYWFHKAPAVVGQAHRFPSLLVGQAEAHTPTIPFVAVVRLIRD